MATRCGPAGSALAPGLRASSEMRRDLCLGDSSQASGAEAENPSDSVEETSAAEHQTEGLGGRRGAQCSRHPPRRWPSRNQSVPSRQSKLPAPRSGKGRMLRQRVSSVGFPSLRRQRGGGPAAKGQSREGRPPCSQTLTVPAQPASKSDGQTLSPRGRSRVGQSRRHGKGVTSFRGPCRNLPASPDVCGSQTTKGRGRGGPRCLTVPHALPSITGAPWLHLHLPRAIRAAGAGPSVLHQPPPAGPADLRVFCQFSPMGPRWSRPPQPSAQDPVSSALAGKSAGPPMARTVLPQPGRTPVSPGLTETPLPADHHVRTVISCLPAGEVRTQLGG